MWNVNLLQRLLAGVSGGFVLAFHDIPPERLEPLVDCLQPARPVPLSEIVERSKRRVSTSGLFAITVDDGVGDTVRNLTRLFKARAWPASFYLPVNYIETGEGMVFQWWRRLKPFLPQRRLELKSGALDLSRPGAIDELSKEMEQRWHTQRLESYLPVTMELADMVMREQNMTRESFRPDAPITWPEVEELSKNDLIRFESHGVSHAAMSSLTDEELALEMKHSRDAVSEHTGWECRHLAILLEARKASGPGR
jgi:peptidoglycan/xylan/chitin deacetylase (PgdA/CDA1 family)